MSEQPEVVLLHTAAIRRFRSTDDHVAKLKEQLPNVDIKVSRNMDESEEMIETAEIAITSRLPTNLLERAENLQWVQALSSGVDFYDLEALKEQNIILTNMAGIHAEPIAEQIMSYMLAFERNLVQAFSQQDEKVWQRYHAGELKGKTVGIIGVGAIGGRLVELSQTFDMEVMGTKRDISTMPDSVDISVPQDELYDLLDSSDYVVVTCPLTDETQGLLGKEEFKVMKSSAIVINIGRGPILDEDALVGALQQNGIGGAALDVFSAEPLPQESPLWDLPNVIVTPHMAGSTPHKRERIAEVFRENYERYVKSRTEELKNRVV